MNPCSQPSVWNELMACTPDPRSPMTLGMDLEDFIRKLGEEPGRKTALYPEILLQRLIERKRTGCGVSSSGGSSGGLAKDEFGSF